MIGIIGILCGSGNICQEYYKGYFWSECWNISVCFSAFGCSEASQSWSSGYEYSYYR